MAITSTNQCGSLSIWWQNTFATLEAILPILNDYPSNSDAEIQSYQRLVLAGTARIQNCYCPSYAREIYEQVLVMLLDLHSSLSAEAEHKLADAMSYLQLARMQWLLLQSNLEKHGIFVSIISSDYPARILVN